MKLVIFGGSFLLCFEVPDSQGNLTPWPDHLKPWDGFPPILNEHACYLPYFCDHPRNDCPNDPV